MTGKLINKLTAEAGSMDSISAHTENDSVETTKCSNTDNAQKNGASDNYDNSAADSPVDSAAGCFNDSAENRPEPNNKNKEKIQTVKKKRPRSSRKQTRTDAVAGTDIYLSESPTLKELTEHWMQLERKTLEQRKTAARFYDEHGYPAPVSSSGNDVAAASVSL